MKALFVYRQIVGFRGEYSEPEIGWIGEASQGLLRLGKQLEQDADLLTNSENTIHSYEVALTLYIGYLEDSRGIGTSGFSKRCFEQTMIEDWLEWLSLERGCSPETCNNRLSSLRTFIKYLASREAKYLYLKSEADNVPLRKTTKKKVNGLTRNAVAAILAEPDQRTKTGVRALCLNAKGYERLVGQLSRGVKGGG